jgi:hypothetical protein
VLAVVPLLGNLRERRFGVHDRRLAAGSLAAKLGLLGERLLLATVDADVAALEVDAVARVPSARSR